MTKDRRLGRGLAALLGSSFDEASVARVEASTPPARTGDSTATGGLDASVGPSPSKADVLHLNVYEIDDNPFQPRRDFSEPEIASLAESLKEHDMLQPILVRRLADRYQLISGERRLRAAIRAGWSTVPARVRVADDRLVAELAIVENLQRKDLNPIEKALSFKRYLDQHHCTQDDLAQRLKIDRSTIANLMRLLELPASILEAVRRGEVTAGHARALLPLGEEHEQERFVDRIRADGLSVRDVERLVQEKVEELDGQVIRLPGQPKAGRRRSSRDQLSSLERQLRLSLGTKVEIRETARGSGRIVIQFSNPGEFERLSGLLTGTPPDRQKNAG